MARKPGHPALIHGGEFGASTEVRIEVVAGLLEIYSGSERILVLDLPSLTVAALGSSVGLHDESTDISISASHPATIEHLIESSPGAIAEDLQSLRKQLGGEFLKKLSLWVPAGIAVLMLTFWLVFTYLVPIFNDASKHLLSWVPIEADVELGEVILRSSNFNIPMYQGPNTKEAIETILQRLVPHAANIDFDYRVEIVKNDSINAFALPGGTIHINRGIIEEVEDPAELVGVIAHEISHVSLRHGVRMLVKELGIEMVLDLWAGSPGGRRIFLLQIAGRLQSKGYSRHLEREADLEAVRMLQEAKFSTSGLVAFLERLEAKRMKQSPIIESLTGWDSTHPELKARIALIEEAAANPPHLTIVPLKIDLKAVRDEIRRW